MPIPFLAAGVIAVTTLTGVGGGVNATMNSREAKGVNKKASELVYNSELKLNFKRKKTNRSIEKLGEQKIVILSSSIKDFIDNFQLLKNVEFDNKTVGIEELKNIGVSKDLLKDLETESFKAAEIASGGLASLGTGVAAAYGAYAGTMALGTASTGAAISGLSGVAATNATLAWLGGGALGVGGHGMVGGTLVLGGIVAGPALAVGGLFMSVQSTKKLNAAKENLEEAKVIGAQMRVAQEVLTSIDKRSDQLNKLLKRSNLDFENSIVIMKNIILTKGTNWANFDENNKQDIHKAFLLAQLIKGVIDTPLLDEDGEITKKSAEVLVSGKLALEKINSHMIVARGLNKVEKKREDREEQRKEMYLNASENIDHVIAVDTFLNISSMEDNIMFGIELNRDSLLLFTDEYVMDIEKFTTLNHEEQNLVMKIGTITNNFLKGNYDEDTELLLKDVEEYFETLQTGEGAVY